MLEKRKLYIKKGCGKYYIIIVMAYEGYQFFFFRFSNWEIRERRKAKEYEKEREKERLKEEEREREAKRLKEFLEDYDDERDDVKYYK